MANLKELAAGGTGGLAMLAVGHPFDTLKVRVQTQPHLYKNALQAATLTISKEGPFALYKGVGALIPIISPYMAVNFLGYSHGKKIFGSEKFSEYFAAGLYSGLYTTPVIGTAERIKCVAQTSKSSSGAVFRDLVSRGGVSTIFRGLEFTLLRECIGSAFYFGTYEFLKQRYIKEHGSGEFPVLQNLLYGGLGGTAMWITVMPFDSIKSRLQVTGPEIKVSEVYRSIRRDVGKNGIGVLYRGLGVTLLRGFPANAACFLGYEKGKQAYEKFFEGR